MESSEGANTAPPRGLYPLGGLLGDDADSLYLKKEETSCLSQESG
jgi:hypothetical protein